MMKLRSLKATTGQQGFTIVELLIATAVLSTILVMVTVMITSIGNLYYKGVTLSQTQDASRTIANLLTQDLELSKGFFLSGNMTESLNGHNYTVYAICQGTARYTFVPNLREGDDSPHVLWRNRVASGTCTPVDLNSNLESSDPTGTELLGKKMRLTSTPSDIIPHVQPGNPNTSYLTFTVAIAYGDDDLLNLSGINTTCKNGTGDQFCATDSLTTGALQRVQ